MTISGLDPVKAASLLANLKDDARRQSATENLVTVTITRNPAAALQMANQLAQVNSLAVLQWASLASRSAEAGSALPAWVEQAQAAGRIVYPKYANPQGADPAVVRAWEQHIAEDAYRVILDTLARTVK